MFVKDGGIWKKLLLKREAFWHFKRSRVNEELDLEAIFVQSTGLYLFCVNMISLRTIGNVVLGWMC